MLGVRRNFIRHKGMRSTMSKFSEDINTTNFTHPKLHLRLKVVNDNTRKRISQSCSKFL